MLAAQRFEQDGRLDKALKYAVHALELDSGHHEACFTAADLFLRNGNNKAAVETLIRGIKADPFFHEAYVMLVKLLVALGRKQEAAQWAKRLAARPDAPPELRAQASQIVG